MKTVKLLSITLIVMCIISCKKEISEKENLTSIKKELLQKKVTNANFKKEVIPLIDELYAKDSIKYTMLHHIAKKASLESNKEIFNQNISNLKDELKFY